jgi:hypothetical protein
MSDRTADAPAELASPEGRESAAGVVGILFGLALVAVCVAFLWRQSVAPIDGSALLAEAFEFGELPYGLEVEAASRLATGERVVALTNPDATEPERAPGAEDDADEASDEPDAASGAATTEPDPDAPAGSPEMEPYDWSTLAIGPAGTPPIRAFVVWYPLASARAELDRQFRWIPWRDLRDFHADGGRMPLERDVDDWSGYEAVYVLERELERGGTFRDWLRVNLTFDNEARVLIARWARGSPASKASVRELLAALAPRAD